MIAVYLGEVDENKILEMRYPFYKDVINELSIKLTHSSVSHILANPYAEKSWETVQGCNPFNIDVEHISKSTGKTYKKVTMAELKSLGLIK
ncbi:MAG: hypothetical protein PWQ70_3347 [Clostridiales bacterium]|nr:hypothetical protein [Clostridiales bacterium]